MKLGFATLLLLGSILFICCTSALSHPHVFIVQRLQIVFDDQGIAGFRMIWGFDEFFSSMVADDYDKNKNRTLEPDEIAVVKEKAFAYIAEYDYFTFVKINDKSFKVKWIKDFTATLNNGKLSYQFFIPCHVRANKNFKEIIIATYDPTYYSAIFFAGEHPASIKNGDKFEIQSSIKEDNSTSIYFGTVNPWALFLKFRLKL